MEAEEIRKNWAVRERMAVCISSNPSGQYLIARGARMARRMDAELYVVHVDREFGVKEANQDALNANLRFAESLGARVVSLKRPKRCRQCGRICPLKTYHPGDLRSRCDPRLAQVSIPIGSSPLPA